MSRREQQWLYWGLGITGFLVLVSASSQKGSKLPPILTPPIKGETKSLEYQVEGPRIIVQPSPDAAWIEPKLSLDVMPQFRTMWAQWSEFVNEAALDYRVPDAWIWAIMWAESQGNPRALSPKGALGLMQLMPYHFKDGEMPYDPRTNIRAGARHLQLIRAKVSDLVQAASMYNAGGPWTNDTWLKSGCKSQYTTKWGYPAEKGFIDKVVEANNTFLGISTS